MQNSLQTKLIMNVRWLRRVKSFSFFGYIIFLAFDSPTLIDLLNCKSYIENHMRVFPVDTKKKEKKGREFVIRLLFTDSLTTHEI